MANCEVCARKGILIYPVRYAVACPADAGGVPGLSGHFKMEGAPQDIGTARYTLRGMRAGYLYCYDEKRKRLKAYLVMPQGLLWNFPLEHLPPAPRTAVFRCINPDEMTYSRCIDIAHAAGDPATNLWLGWSNVAWTKDLIGKVDDAAWRHKHMQCINIPALLAGSAPHTAEFKSAYRQIAHFGIDKAAMLKAFAFSNTSIAHEAQQKPLGPLIAETMSRHAPYNKGYIVALNDPVGITNDLSELTLPTVDAGFDEDIARGKMVYDMLDMAEKSIREDARKNVSLAENIAKMSENNPDGDVFNSSKSLWKVIKAGGLAKYEAKVRADKKKYGDHLAGRQDAEADQAWEEVSGMEKVAASGKRASLLDEARRKNFPDVYARAMKDFQPINAQLAQAHVAWLKSPQLANWMAGVHDPQDMRSGYAFSASLGQCIGKAVSSQPCSEQLLAWLNNGNLSDPRNLYSRALLFNHEELIKATESQLKGSDIQYENILNIYKVALMRFDAGRTLKLMDRLALGTANILVKALKDGSYSVMRSMALTHLRLIGGVVIKTSGSSPGELAAWVFAQSKEHGIVLNESETKSKNAAYRAADKTVKKNPPNSGLIAYELDMAELQANRLINEHAIKSVRIPGFDKTKAWLGSSAPQVFQLGVVTTIIQMIALAFVCQDFINEDPFNRTERRIKGLAAVVGLSAALVDIAASTVEKSPSHPLAAFLPAQWAMDADRAKFVARTAQKIGLFAGLVIAAYDIFINSVGSFLDGNDTLGVLYAANGLLSATVAIAAYYAWAIFWPLLIVSFIVGIVIALISMGALQEWISRCYFSQSVSAVREKTKGKSPFQSYPYHNADEEVKAYNTAMGI